MSYPSLPPSQRAAQREATRQRILDRFIELLAGGDDDVSVERLANAVGVSVRTVYFHFPDRAALVAAVDERINRELLHQPDYTSPDDLIDKVAAEFRDAAANADLVRAQLRAGAGEEVRARSRQLRAARVRKALKPVLDGVPRDEARRALAVVLLLRGIDTWKVLHDDLGLGDDDAAEAVRWALTALVDDLRRRSDQ